MQSYNRLNKADSKPQTIHLHIAQSETNSNLAGGKENKDRARKDRLKDSAGR